MGFIKTTVIGGVVFLMPVVVLVIVLLKAMTFMVSLAHPLAAVLPVDTIGGVALANVLGGVLVVLVCFLAGLLARTRIAKAALQTAERGVLQKLPGYTMLRGLTNTLDPTRAAELHPVLVSLDDAARIAVEVERLGDGRVVVYFPDAPNAWSGTVQLIDAGRVRRLDVPITAVVSHIEQLGRDSAKLFAGRTSDGANASTTKGIA